MPIIVPRSLPYLIVSFVLFSGTCFPSDSTMTELQTGQQAVAVDLDALKAGAITISGHAPHTHLIRIDIYDSDGKVSQHADTVVDDSDWVFVGGLRKPIQGCQIVQVYTLGQSPEIPLSPPKLVPCAQMNIEQSDPGHGASSSTVASTPNVAGSVNGGSNKTPVGVPHLADTTHTGTTADKPNSQQQTDSVELAGTLNQTGNIRLTGTIKQDSTSTQDIPAKYKPDVELLLGIGSQVISPSVTNYQIVNNSVIQQVNLGAVTPQIMTGLSFALPFRLAKQSPSKDESSWHWHAFASVKFVPGSQDGINGYVLGISYRVAKYLDLLAGFTLTPAQEISPGFQEFAVQAFEQNPTAYSAFNLSKLMTNAKHAFDGFPIQKQGAGASGNLFNGNPLETKYNGGLVLGFAFPLDLKKLFTSGTTVAAQSGAPK